MSRIAAIGSSAASTPFQVTLSTVGGGSVPNRASVYWNSSLLLNQVLNNTLAITGLANAPSPTSDGNPNWFAFDSGNDLIWLEINVVANTAKINSYGLGGTWAPGDLPGRYGSGHGPFEYQISYDSSSNKIFTQYIARIAIFASIASTHTPYPVSNLQLLNTNLMLEGDDYGGALYTSGDGPAGIGLTMPKPFAGPYISL